MTQTPGVPAPQQPAHEPPQQPAQQPAQGMLRLTIQGNELTAGLTPTVVVSGHRVNSRFGVMDLPVWAGPNRVEIHTTWMRRYGEASLDVVVHPGEVVPVFYAVPWHQFTRGAIGHEKQARPGQGAMVAVFATIALGCAALVMALAVL